jgi:hypothetical protein
VEPQQEYYQFAGRTYPVLFTGEALDQSGGASGELLDDPASEALFEELARWGGPVVYRDTRGRRVVVGAKVRMSEGAGARVTQVQVQMRRIDA